MLDDSVSNCTDGILLKGDGTISQNTFKSQFLCPQQEYMIKICGPDDRYLTTIERRLEVEVVHRGDTLTISGLDEERVKQTRDLFIQMLEAAQTDKELSSQDLRYALDTLLKKGTLDLKSLFSELVCITFRGKPIRAKTARQHAYLRSMSNNTIVFGIGPAGTGKTYLAVCEAVKELKNGTVSRVVLVRPAVEAGESLGYLPGDLREKVEPYLRPLYDAFFELLSPEKFYHYVEKNVIEVAPLAYMRGRTLNDSFIILDEAQNTTPEQMKMFLTRIGFGSKAVVTGDLTQVDLPNGRNSGLKVVQEILKNIEGIDFIHLQNEDVIRHEIVQKVVAAYEQYDLRHQSK